MRVVVALAEPWTSAATRLREREISGVWEKRDGGCTVLARVEERAPGEQYGDNAGQGDDPGLCHHDQCGQCETVTAHHNQVPQRCQQRGSRRRTATWRPRGRRSTPRRARRGGSSPRASRTSSSTRS